MDYRGLIAAVAEIPPPPCEVFKCQYREKCANEKLACKAFQDYVYTGLAVAPSGLPSRRKYAVVMRSHEHPQARGNSKNKEADNG